MAWIPNVTQRFSRKGWDNENWFEKFRNLRHRRGYHRFRRLELSLASLLPLFRSLFLFHAAPQLTERLEEASRYSLNREFYVSVRNLTPYENGTLESLKKMPKQSRELQAYVIGDTTGKGEAKRRWKEKDFFFFACFAFLPLPLFSIPLPRLRLNACHKRPDIVLRSGLVAPDKTKIGLGKLKAQKKSKNQKIRFKLKDPNREVK